MNAIPRVSIIMPMLNEQANIVRLLGTLKAQKLPADEFELIVVDNGSKDDTLRLVQEFVSPFSVRVLQQRGTIGQIRNAGAALARAEILGFLDADCFPRADWLEEALRFQCKDHVWGADYLPQEDATWVGLTWFEFQAALRDGPVSFLPSSNLFLYRSAFQMLGGFSGLVTSEDVDLCRRARKAGLQVVAHTSMAVLHEGTPRLLKQFYRQNRWHGTHVFKAFVQQLPALENLRLVLLTLYTLVAFWAFLAVLLLAILFGRAGWIVAAAFLLLLPAAALSLVRTLPARRFGAIPKLFVLYQVYLSSRAAAVVRRRERNHR